jgi:hypothetical protein
LKNVLTFIIAAVIDRQFKGEIASTMDKLTTRALQAQVEAAVRISKSICAFQSGLTPLSGAEC